MNDCEKIIEQENRLKQYVHLHPNDEGVSINLYNAYGKFPCIKVDIDSFILEIQYHYSDDFIVNQIQTYLYYSFLDKMGLSSTKPFMMKRDVVSPVFSLFQKPYYDYYRTFVSSNDWAEKMIKGISIIRQYRDSFLKLCRLSCPYNSDGTHKFKSWQSTAKVSIIRKDNIYLTQGWKKGEFPLGNHVVGGNGSHVCFDKSDYGILITVEKISFEKPIKGKQFENLNEYLRSLMEKLGRNRMPYKLLNSKLPQIIKVITYDMNEDPISRHFVPVEYGGDWLIFLKKCFKDL